VFDSLRTDLAFGIRTLRKTPMVAAVLVATLALGIAATSVTFSLVNGFFIRPLAIDEPGRFVRIFNLSANGQYSTISYPDFLDLRALRNVFGGALAEEPAAFSLGVTGSLERVWGELVRMATSSFRRAAAEGRFLARTRIAVPASLWSSRPWVVGAAVRQPQRAEHDGAPERRTLHGPPGLVP
jgi:hypothetical protein